MTTITERKEWPKGLWKSGDGPKLRIGDLPEASPVTVSTIEISGPVFIGLGAIWFGKYGDCARCGQPLAGQRVRTLIFRNGPSKIVHNACVSTAEWLDAISRPRRTR